MRADPSEAIVTELRRRGIAAPALLLLDAHRPLRPLLGQTVVFLLPLMRPLLGEARARGLERTLNEEGAYQRLLQRLREEVSADA